MWNAFGIVCGKHTPAVNSIAHPVLGDPVYIMQDATHIIKNLKAALVNGQQ